MESIFGDDSILVIDQTVANKNSLSLGELANLAVRGILITPEDGDYLYDILTKEEVIKKLRNRKKSTT